MATPNPEPYYRVEVTAGTYTWTIERDPAVPATPDYGLADPLRVKVALPNGDLLYKNPEPVTGSFAVIVADMADVAALQIGDGVHVRVWLFDTGTVDPVTSAPYTDLPEVNVRGRVANLDAVPHPLGMLLTVRFVDYSTDLAEMTIGAADWPSETIEDRLNRIDTELSRQLLTVAFSQEGPLAARDASPVNARDYLTALTDSVANVTRLSNVLDFVTGQGSRMVFGSIYADAETPTPGVPDMQGLVDYWAVTSLVNRLPYQVGELPAVLDEVAPGVYGVVVEDHAPDHLARVVSAAHVEFSAAYALGKSDRIDTWQVTLEDGSLVTVSEASPVPVQGRIETASTTIHDATDVALFNLNGSDTDGWKADRFLWHADLDPHRLRYPNFLFWDDIEVLKNVQLYPTVIDGIQAHQNPTGETWYAGQLVSAEFILNAGRYVVDMEHRRNLAPPAVQNFLPDFAGDAQALTPDGYWRMADAMGTSLTDSSPNAHHGTVGTSHPTSVAGLLFGDANAAMLFPGLYNSGSSMAAVPYGAWMNRSTFTAFCWFRTSDTGLNYLFTRWSGTTASEIFGIDLQSSNVIRGYAKIGGTNRILAPTVTGLRDNAPHMVALTYDGTELRLQVDAVTVATLTIATALQTSLTSELRMGHRVGAANGEQLNGVLDECWFGPALSAAQVADLYAAGTGSGSGVPAGAYLTPDTIDPPTLTPDDLDPNMSAFDARLLRSVY